MCAGRSPHNCAHPPCRYRRSYSTYLGGTNSDEGYSIAVDAEGSAYVTGLMFSGDFPTVNSLQPALAGNRDAFVAKFGVNSAPPLTDLASLIVGFGLTPVIADSLLAKVGAAQASLAHGNTTAACNQLQALINQARAKSGKYLTADQATAIITADQASRPAIGCK